MHYASLSQHLETYLVIGAALFGLGLIGMGQQYSERFQLLVFLAFFIAFAIKVPMIPYHYGSSLHKTGQARVKRQMPLRAGAGLMPAPARGVVWRR